MKSSYALGLFYIFTVSIIWSAASILVQYLYEGLDFDSPFLLTYIGTSLFIILIPAYFIFENGWKFQNYSSCCDSCGTRGNNKDQYESPLEQHNTSSEGTPLSHHLDECFDDSLDDIDPQYGLQEELQLEERNSENHAFPDEGQSDYQNNDHHYFLSQMEHLKMAAKIAPWWFVSNYFYNLSLKYTTIT